METTRKNFDGFKHTLQAKKGAVGEQIVRTYFENEGWIVYQAITTGGHCFDFLAIKNRGELQIVEVKSKAKREKYADTGFNTKHYDEYKKISEQYNMPIFIAFVDEKAGEVYGNYLHELEKRVQIKYSNRTITYPYKENFVVKGQSQSITFFPLQHMLPIGRLDENDISRLKQYGTRNPIYDSNINP